MSPLVRHLSTYAAYHRDGRNVVTHMIGIPLIVLAIAILTSRPAIPLGGGLILTPMLLIAVVATIGYLRIDAGFGVAMATFLALVTWAGGAIAALPTSQWLTIGVGSFLVGWAFQFVGHYFEGRKPAFVDDLSSLFIGPLFVVAEIAFLLGLRRQVRTAIEGQQRR